MKPLEPTNGFGVSGCFKYYVVAVHYTSRLVMASMQALIIQPANHWLQLYVIVQIVISINSNRLLDSNFDGAAELVISGLKSSFLQTYMSSLEDHTTFTTVPDSSSPNNTKDR